MSSVERGLILTLNSGASSLKFALFESGELDELPLAEGSVDNIGQRTGCARLDAGALRLEERALCANHEQALEKVCDMLRSAHLPDASAAGHRVVHGGPGLVRPVLVDDAVLEQLRECAPLAPLHLPASIAGIEAVRSKRGASPQVVCFDTSFHQALPELTSRLPLPALEKVRRYGFHGLSYEFVMSTLPAPVPSRIVIAPLGNGASLVAVRDGRSIDTTMSLTPGGCILKGTRSGDIDPGLLFYLARTQKLSIDDLENIVERQSGLLALGGTADMKTLLAASPCSPSARLAVETFGYAVRKGIGAYVAALGGLDLLVFTGGIGEGAAVVRAEACRGLQLFGIDLDEARNAANAKLISRETSRCPVQVVKTNEDLMLARHTRALLGHHR